MELIMERIIVPVKKLPHGLDLPLPQYMTVGASGLDLLAAIEEDLTLPSGAFLPIPTGIAIALPEGYEGQVRPRSGLAARYGITTLNTPGTIDSDYRGEIKVILINHGPEDFILKRGERLAQLVIARVTHVEWDEVKELSETGRGAGGLGHTGR